ncbi:MAG: hypothetical protein IKT40_13330 [Bacilli bacterium]|nr:hypothetical protein [Bacilli bacterium]
MAKYRIGDIVIDIKGLSNRHEELLKSRMYEYDGENNSQIKIEIEYVINQEESMIINSFGDESKYYLYKVLNGNLIGYIEHTSLKGKIFIKKKERRIIDGIEFVLTRIISYYAPLFGYLLLHSSCISIGENGICFAGDSEVGKTTMTKIFSNDFDTQILSEDLSLIKCINDCVYLDTIPIGNTHFWNSPKESKIKIIFFVNKGKNLIIENINIIEIYKLLTLHQLYKYDKYRDLKADFAMQVAKSIMKNCSFYKITYDAKKYYNKDWKYICNLKETIRTLLNNELNIKNEEKKEEYVLNKDFQIRNLNNKIEIWNSKEGNLLGITKECFDFIKKIENNEITLDDIPENYKQIFEECIKNKIIRRKI